MATDGPADPSPAGANASEAEGSIFSRLRAPAREPQSPQERAAEDLALETAGTGHESINSSAVNPGVLAASREAAGPDDSAASRPGSIGVAGIGLANDSTPAQSGFAAAGPETTNPAAAKGSEYLTIACFGLSVLGVIGFVVAFILGDPHKEYYNPLLGAAMGIALLGVGAAGVVWAKYVMPHEDAVQDRHEGGSTPQDIQAAQDLWRHGVELSGFVSRPLIRRSLLTASGALGVLAIIPLRSLGKLTSNQNAGELAKTHWHKGARLLAVPSMQPIRAGDLAVGALATVIPEGTESDDQAQADSVAVLIRLQPSELKPLPGRDGLDYFGHVVYSKICTHLGCPVSLYEQQTHRLLCPCHQSQFLATENARPVFGPADRRLPQLALSVDKDGYFISREADFPEPIGPSYWERT